jgi:hypothetical protein
MHSTFVSYTIKVITCDICYIRQLHFCVRFLDKTGAAKSLLKKEKACSLSKF